MNIKINPSSISGEIKAISSKSDAHRVLISSALADKPTDIEIYGESIDIKTTMECLSSMGARVEKLSQSQWRIFPLWENINNTPLINSRESGSTLRFLMPITAALGMNATFVGEGRLPKRPMSVLLEQLSAHGVGFNAQTLPQTISGKLNPGKFELPGDISSQYITGLLFALALLKSDSEIILNSKLESKAYVDMTISTLKEFGIKIGQSQSGYIVYGNQTFRSPQNISLQGDWSNAAFWLSAGAISGKITCSGLDLKSTQGDKAIVEILREFGAEVKVEGGSVTISKNQLTALEIDGAEIPDLIPILTVVAACAKGVTKIHNAKRLRLKESDRLTAMAHCLSRVGVEVREFEDGLAIKGNPHFKGATVKGFGDHRIVMSMAVASTMCEGDLIIEGAQAVEKSYPDFFKHFNMLGGNFSFI